MADEKTTQERVTAELKEAEVTFARDLKDARESGAFSPEEGREIFGERWDEKAGTVEPEAVKPEAPAEEDEHAPGTVADATGGEAEPETETEMAAYAKAAPYAKVPVEAIKSWTKEQRKAWYDKHRADEAERSRMTARLKELETKPGAASTGQEGQRAEIKTTPVSAPSLDPGKLAERLAKVLGSDETEKAEVASFVGELVQALRSDVEQQMTALQGAYAGMSAAERIRTSMVKDYPELSEQEVFNGVLEQAAKLFSAGASSDLESAMRDSALLRFKRGPVSAENQGAAHKRDNGSPVSPTRATKPRAKSEADIQREFDRLFEQGKEEEALALLRDLPT